MRPFLIDPFFDTFDKIFDSYRYYEQPKTNIRKNENEYKIQVIVPGLTKDDLKIKVQHGVLKISYEKDEKVDKTYFVSNFTKSYSIPDDVKESDIDGKVENGVLELILPITQKKVTERLIDLK